MRLLRAAPPGAVAVIAFFAQGGLGNQMFQYAAARSLALRRGTGVVVDPSWYAPGVEKTTPRALDLLGLRIEARLADEPQWAGFARLRGRVRSRLPFGRRWRPRREPRGRFDERLLDAADGSYLIGYWQSWRYFEPIRPSLAVELQPKAPPGDRDRDLLERIAGTEAIAVHVRRTDYVQVAQASAVHGVCAPDYYVRALSLLSGELRRPEVFVFSDDPKWCREHLDFDAPTTFVDRTGQGGALDDLRLMAACRHFVIANSTYSWWGAWLGRHPAKRVVAPARWYADGRPTPDLLPPGGLLA